jgi:bifunctional non-homologous end joining protein LigD
MSLKEYKHKRNFKLTPEPAGAVSKQAAKGLQFVIQKHAASHLHYDFRLAMAGVLKSWAIPKGPSLNPADKRLAVQVEDHPIEYADFEGEIPQGQYGGGEVIVWDNGTWECDGDPVKSWQTGKLRFSLQGKKLQGKWLLLRTAFKKSSKPQWLLRKEQDEAADRINDITVQRPESVISGRKLQVDKNSSSAASTQSKKPTAIKKKSVVKTASKVKPGKHMFQPQLATLVDTLPIGPQWLYEMKYDGYRILAEINQQQIVLWTRHHNDWTAKFPIIAQALKNIKADYALLDGEVVVINDNGQSDFQALQNAMNQNNEDALHYYVFDLLKLDNENIAELPLVKRKERLKKLLLSSKLNNHVHFSEHLQGQDQGKAFYKTACAGRYEGIMAKRADRAYYFGRNEDWLKIKCNQRQEFVIGGFTEPAGSRVAFGALLLGYYDAQQQLHYAGKVGTGFTVASLRTLYKTLSQYIQSKPAFIDPPTGFRAQKVHWLKPALIAEVEFTGWTQDNRARHPSFRGLREDKAASEVTREQVKELKQLKQLKQNNHNESVVAGVTITHPDKIFYPTIKLSKLAVARYYESVADWLLPYVKNRPLNIMRCPDGIEGECFFQKHITHKLPAGIEQVTITQNDKTMDSFIIKNISGLINLVQFGALEFHTWGESSLQSGHPDQVIFDLDPETNITWPQIIETALLLKDVLADLDLISFVKTTGGKGLHIVVPLKPIYNWQQIHQFAKAVANTLVKLNPKLFIATTAKAKRSHKIFIDYLRNSQGATAIAPYSTRARAGAPVAMPLAWDELSEKITSNYFTVNNIQERLAKLKRDPWQKFFKLKQILSKEILEKINN